MKSFIKKSFSVMFVLCFMFVCFGLFGKTKVNADSNTYTFTSKAWADNTNSWTSGKDGNQMQSGRGVQVTTGASGANATTEKSFTNVKRIIVTYSTNASAGAGSIAFKIGTNSETSLNVTKTGGTTDRTLTFDYDTPQTGAIKITVTCTTNSIYVKSVEIIEVVTVTFNSNGGSSVDNKYALPGNKITAPDNPTRDGFLFNGWYKEIELENQWNFDTDTLSTNTTLYAKWISLGIKYNVIFDSNGGSAVASVENLNAGELVPKPSDPTKDGNTFLGWFNGNDKWDFDNDLISSNITLIAHWLENSVLTDLNDIESYMSLGYKYETNPTDSLNFSNIGISGTSYTDWSNKSFDSLAKYVGNSAGSNDSIQLRSSSNSGIVQTTTGGKVKKITVSWNSNTADGRTLDIYGKNTAYSAPSDLYNASTRGTKIGSIVYGTSTELTIATDYEYIGIRSNSNALYLDSVEIEIDGFADVDFRLKCGVDDILELVGDGLVGAEVGIEVSAGGKAVKKALGDSTIHYDTTNGIKYIVIDLGDLLNNTSRLDVEFTVKAYFAIDGNTFYSTSTKTYSVVDMIEEYNTSGPQSVKDAIAGLVTILTEMGKLS